MNGTMTTNETLEGIALKLWWGWIPQWRSKKWSIVFEHRTEKMTEEEVQWFRSN